MSTNGNGYKISFWILSTITTVFMLSIVGAVVANDKESRSRDIEIVRELTIKLDTLIKENNIDHTAMKVDLMRITASLGIKKND